MQHSPGKAPDPNDKLWRHLLIAFVIAAAVYAAAFFLIEKRRVTHTPWVVFFEADAAGDAVVVVRQESLGLGPIQVRISPAEPAAALTRTNIIFNSPQSVPRPMPIGSCVFEDLTFLPGTVVLRVHGVDVQMLPRALTVGTNEFSWTGTNMITVPGAEQSTPK